MAWEVKKIWFWQCNRYLHDQYTLNFRGEGFHWWERVASWLRPTAVKGDP